MKMPLDDAWHERGTQEKLEAVAFGEVAKADAASKATGLAKGIEEAMNCTAFGLITAVFALLMMGLLNGKTQKIIDDMNAASVQVLNLVVGTRPKVDLQNKPAE